MHFEEWDTRSHNQITISEAELKALLPLCLAQYEVNMGENVCKVGGWGGGGRGWVGGGMKSDELSVFLRPEFVTHVKVMRKNNVMK